MPLPPSKQLFLALIAIRKLEAMEPCFHGTSDELLQQWFVGSHASMRARMASANRRVAKVVVMVARLNKARRIWNWFIVDKYLRRARAVAEKAGRRERRIRDEIANAFAQYKTINAAVAERHIARAKASAWALNVVERLEQQLSKVDAVIQKHTSAHGEAALGIRWRDALLSASPARNELPEIEQEVNVVEDFVQRTLPVRAAQATVAKKAIAVLKECLDINPDAGPPTKDAAGFLTATVQTLNAALRPEIERLSPVQSGALATCLKSAVHPASFRRADAWLVLWTAVKATSDYYRKAYGSRYSENLTGAAWCDAWEAQVSEWGVDVCSALALPHDSIHVARGNFQNLSPETATGSDVLLVLSTQFGGKTQVRLAFIQFKKSSDAEYKIDVWQKGLRQYSRLERLHQPTMGSSSMHALLSTRHSGLAAVPAVDVIQSKAAINAARGQPADGPASAWTIADCKVDWRHYGQSFCTLLTHSLCTDGLGSFDDAKSAFDWISEHCGVDPAELPRYMVFQAVGERARTLAYAMETEAKRWARALGLRYGSPDRGHSLRM